MIRTSQEVIEKVAAGAEWLDETHPGWEREIDLAVLDLGDCSMCVLGQVFGGYFIGLTYTDTREWDWAANHGFNISLHGYWSYDTLREVWVDLIKERFNTGNLSG